MNYRWSEAKMLKLIELYEEEENLWSSERCFERNVCRREAWARIKNKLDRKLNVSEVKRKMKELLATFKKYHTSIVRIRLLSRGATTVTVKPSWFAYDALERFYGEIYEGECLKELFQQINYSKFNYQSMYRISAEITNTPQRRETLFSLDPQTFLINGIHTEPNSRFSSSSTSFPGYQYNPYQPSHAESHPVPQLRPSVPQQFSPALQQSPPVPQLFSPIPLQYLPGSPQFSTGPQQNSPGSQQSPPLPQQYLPDTPQFLTMPQQYLPVPQQSVSGLHQYSPVPQQPVAEAHQYLPVPQQSVSGLHQYSPVPQQSVAETHQYSPVPQQFPPEPQQSFSSPHQSSSLPQESFMPQSVVSGCSYYPSVISRSLPPDCPENPKP